ncbi:18881_t:CDS:2 [Acaulospora morrowiae]|uniref:18881_t:CDS:1 n=1 Tax=Acaulospora morrowiae TaxID=94023 RepID=A0A9N8ZZP9_9GLOM|nr:18881_t:CDS:2 [Acaulospora morrowiae]
MVNTWTPGNDFPLHCCALNLDPQPHECIFILRCFQFRHSITLNYGITAYPEREGYLAITGYKVTNMISYSVPMSLHMSRLKIISPLILGSLEQMGLRTRCIGHIHRAGQFTVKWVRSPILHSYHIPTNTTRTPLSDDALSNGLRGVLLKEKPSHNQGKFRGADEFGNAPQTRNFGKMLIESRNNRYRDILSRGQVK